MSKARSTGNIGNIIKTSATCVTVNDGTTDLLIMSGSGRVTIPGNLVVLGGIAGSSAESSSYSLSSSFATNANTLDGIDGASFLQTGSFNTFSSSIDTTIKNKLNGDGVISGSVQVDITNTTEYSTFSSSLSSSIGSLSGSVATTTSGLSSSIGSLSSSVATNTSGLAGRITTIEGNYATTGSNIFVGSQVITGSLYITNDMIVQGCSCLQNITASAVSIGTNVVMLNTATPAVRFAGISVQDSGSNAGVTGSIFWDGLCNKWIYSNPSTVGYTGGMLISGPRNTGTIGSESPLTCNYIAKSGGGDHLYDSCIIDDGTTVCVNANLKGSGTACFTSTLIAGGNALIGTSTASTAISLNDILTIGASTTSNAVKFTNGGSTNWGYIITEATKIVIGTDNNIDFETGGGCRRMRITSGGIACFAGTVCAPSGITAGCGDIIVDPIGKCVTVGRISAISGDNSTFVVRDRTDALRAVIPGGGSINTVFRTNASCVIVQNYSGTDMFRVANDGTAYFSANVGIGTTSPSSPLSICGTFNGNTPFICMTGTGTGVYQRVIAAINPGMNAGDDLTIQMGTALCYRNVGQLNYHHEGAGCATNRMSIGLYGVDDVFNVTGNGFVGIGTTTTCGLLSINAPVTSVPSIRFQNSITAGLDSAISNYVSAAQTLLVLGTNSYITSAGTICRFNTSYESSYISFDEGTVRIGTGPTSSNSSAKFTVGPTGVATFSCQIQTNGACVIVNRGDGNPAVLSLGNTQNSYQIQFTCTGGQRIAFVNGTPSEFASFYGTGVSVFTSQTCINGSGAGLQFTGGNNRIYFGACRALEGSTSGTILQIGENYSKTQIQSSAQMYNGSNGNSPKLYFGEEGNETPGAKAIYLDTYWMIIQPHVNEGLRIRAVNGAGAQCTIAKFYGMGTFSLDQYSNGTLSVSSGIVVSSSDKCMKIDDGAIDIALPKIMCLNPRYFYWKPETCLNSCDRQLGFYAQDVSEVLGTEVANQSHNCSWGIYDRGIIAMLTKGIQEQQCTINTLKTCLGIN